MSNTGDAVRKNSKGRWLAVSLSLVLGVYALAADAAEVKIGFVNAARADHGRCKERLLAAVRHRR